MDKNTESKIQELQLLEQNLQNILMQKQAFQIELNETDTALEEVKKSKDEVYKITGNIMIKSSKDSLLKELEEKKKLLELRLKAIEKQEASLAEKATVFREEIVKEISETKQSEKTKK
jgi:prefoldin beta subunit